MSGDSYPDPECDFGVAVRQDIKYIKDKLEEILEAQEEHSETLENGLTTKVDRIDDRIERIEQERETEEERERKEDKKKEGRKKRFYLQLVITIIGELIAFGGGVGIAWLSFN